MTNETISLNEDFKDLLLCVEGNDVKRKELINMAASKFELSTKQAEGFVARNIHKLQQVNLINASGQKGKRTYHLSRSLQQRISSNEPFKSKLKPESEDLDGDKELIDEEVKTQVSLEMILSELEAYSDLQKRFPRSRAVVQGLLKETKKESIQLYGRLNALKKVIHATTQRSIPKC
ncbi:hypothetical protein DN730_18835 [Marinomonas piezotolerans]|uniref:Response regulator n=1 Tax=Marinomonas piezotolerans TaxID=2213058 RepID=A0A370U4A8_9GAMM|nr:hypothetical protein [Marinomonas piezotolerans]RDL42598.1 hypothetical protein DN730_18835 [Marinomonas piezotolerans]|tara:strand:+ start:18969 stop:19499 length:531 start_codon:yes stop_codon:yes gene_type:complete